MKKQILGLIISEWRYPFPYNRGLKTEIGQPLLNITLITSLLIYFRPFGLSSKSIYEILGFGGAAVIIMLFQKGFWYFIGKSINHTKWTIGKQVLRALLDLILLTAGLLIYYQTISKISLSYNFTLQFLLITVLSGLIPLALRVSRTKSKLLQKSLSEALKLNELLQDYSETLDPAHSISFKSDIVNEGFSVTRSNLLFAKSESNYLTFFIYEKEKKKVTDKTLRLSLNKAVAQSERVLFRCHRSYAVNLDLVSKIVGSPQGFRLQLQKIDELIPVSRKYTKEIRALLKAKSKA